MCDKWLNEQLSDNVCVMTFEFTLFVTFLQKLKNIWTGIITPKQEEKDVIKWVMPYLEYNSSGKNYLIWFFKNDKNMSKEDILKEINQFLKDEKEEKK